MYTQRDYEAADAAKKRRLYISFALLALALISMIVGCVIRNKAMTTWIAGLIGCVFYAVLELYAMPFVRYSRYLRDVEQGLSRQTDAWFVGLSEQPRANNGVQFYDFVVREDEEGEERLFYYDADKPLPSYKAGQRLHIVSFGNYITDMGTL